MTNRYFPQPTLPFVIDDAQSNYVQEFEHIDVVESIPITSPRDHPHCVDEPGEAVPRLEFDSNIPLARHRRPTFVAQHDREDLALDRSPEQTSGDDSCQSASLERLGTDRQCDIKASILKLDHIDRESVRFRRRGLGVQRSGVGDARFGTMGRRRATQWSGFLATRFERTDRFDSLLRWPAESDQRRGGHRDQPDMSSADRPDQQGNTDQLAIDTPTVKRRFAGPINGSALAMYFLLLPYVVVSRWGSSMDTGHRWTLRIVLVILSMFWSAFAVQMLLNVRRIRHGLSHGVGGSAWLAGLIVAGLSMIFSTNGGPAQFAPRPSSAVSPSTMSAQERDASTNHHLRRSHPKGLPPGDAISMVPLALMAKRRGDLLREHQSVDSEQDVDSAIEVLRGLRPGVIDHIHKLMGNLICGLVECADDCGLSNEEEYSLIDPCVVCYLGPSSNGGLVSFSREGGRLGVRPNWSDEQIRESVVALHRGKLVFTTSTEGLIRALAVRSIHKTLVVHLGSVQGLDGDLASSCVTVFALANEEADPFALSGASAVKDAVTSSRFAIRVNLLRADPTVDGLVEPFTPTLRRRCLEMLAYLALHRQEPITGERIRSRVLTYADVDASSRTLANTASSIRRSIGSDSEGPRLHGVTSSGLYVTHGVASDLEDFTNLVARARRLPVVEAAPLARQALALVQGEPLASALRGYEWFLAEGFASRLSRDGEWSALLVHHLASELGDYELAFWAIQQGLLIDPYSSVLRDTLTIVPRLRQFRSDRPHIAQDQSIRSGGAVAMSWSLNGLGNQVTK